LLFISLQVEQLFDVGSAVRKVMYTTNALESVNSSLRIVTRKGAFPNEDALRKLLYLRVRELSKKWGQRPVPNWALVRNQLETDDTIRQRIQKYDFSLLVHLSPLPSSLPYFYLHKILTKPERPLKIAI